MDEPLLNRIRLHGVFRGLEDDEIQELINAGEIQTHQAEEVIHHLGDLIDSIYLVVQGRLKISVKAPGGEFQTIRYVGPGDQFGLLILISDEKLPVQATVDERAVLLKIPADKARELADQYPLLRRNLFHRLGLSVKNSIIKQRKRNLAKLAVFTNVDDDSRAIVTELANRLADCEKVGVIGDRSMESKDGRYLFNSFTSEDGRILTPERIRKLILAWDSVDRIFIITDGSLPGDQFHKFVEQADIVFRFSTTAEAGNSIDALQQLYRTEPSWKTKTHFVWTLKGDEQVVPYVEELYSLVERDFKVHLATSGELARLRTQGITRLVHYLRGISIGIALSGGAAHGMAHLGVLKALDEAGITIDRMAGTSAGVLTGLVYCAGKTTEFGIKQFPTDLKPGSIYRSLPFGEGFYLLRKYRGRKWEPMLRKYFSDWRLEQLPIPLCSVTTDMISAERVVRRTGDAVNATIESINLPILSEPIKRDGQLLVDGVFVDNLPADILVKQGCNFVIGVDVTENIEKKFGNNTPETPANKMKLPGLVATLVRCLHIQAHNLSQVGAKAADVIIAPDVSRFSPTSFVETAAMAEVGYETTRESLPRIQEILADLDPGIFGESSSLGD